jgi:hypothetical protein
MKLVLNAKVAALVEEVAAVDMEAVTAAQAVVGAVDTVEVADAAVAAVAGTVVTAADMEAADAIANQNLAWIFGHLH